MHCRIGYYRRILVVAVLLGIGGGCSSGPRILNMPAGTPISADGRSGSGSLETQDADTDDGAALRDASQRALVLCDFSGNRTISEHREFFADLNTRLKKPAADVAELRRSTAGTILESFDVSCEDGRVSVAVNAARHGPFETLLATRSEDLIGYDLTAFDPKRAEFLFLRIDALALLAVEAKKIDLSRWLSDGHYDLRAVFYDRHRGMAYLLRQDGRVVLRIVFYGTEAPAHLMLFRFDTPLRLPEPPNAAGSSQNPARAHAPAATAEALDDVRPPGRGPAPPP